MNASPVAKAALRALGASATAIPSAGAIAGLDGIEQQIDTVYTNHYERQARYLTGNVALWPRPLVLFMRRRRFAALRAGERAVLQAAATAAVAPMVALQRRRDAQAAAALCRRGLIVGEAAPGDLAALRHALRSVYDTAGPATRSAVAAIQTLKARLGTPADTVRPCPGRTGPSVTAALPDGAYVVTITRRDALRAGLPADNELARVPRHRFRLVLHAGSFTLLELNRRPPTVGFEGSFSLYRDRVVAKGDNGDELQARWSLRAGRLRFAGVTVTGLPPVNQYAVVWGSRPWTRAG